MQERKKRVLFLYASLDSGHQKAAQAIEEAFLSRPHLDVETMDIEALKFSYPNLGKLIHRVYMIMVTNMSRFYDFLWDNATIEKRIRKLKSIMNEKRLKKFEELFFNFKAQVAVCTQALPCGFLATLKRKKGFSFKLIAVITDYDVHAYWIYDEVDVYCVATVKCKEKLIQKGVPKEKVKITGIPISPHFTKREEKKKLRERWNISQKTPCALIMGGSYGVGPMLKIIKHITKLDTDFSIAVITGKNAKLYKKLEEKKRKIKREIKLFTYIQNVNQLMQLSDILITKPGGLTISEALCMGLPMIVTRGVRGQESENFRYLLEKGAALSAEKPQDVAERLDELLREEKQLKIMRENALRAAKPKAAWDISQVIENFL